MYTMIIVDDEWIVREGLKQTIPWQDLDCNLIGEASGGRTALQLIKDHKPDILLTDIRMPGMDGLELAEQVSVHSENTKVVFLTGFDEFTYAQQALKIGATDYVLKPTDADELIRVVKRVTRLIDDERSRLGHEEKWKEKLASSRHLLLEKVLTQYCLDQAGDQERELLEEIMGKEQLYSAFGSFHAAIVEWESNESSELSKPVYEHLESFVSNIADSRLESKPCWLIPIDETRAAFIHAGQWSLEEEELVKQLLQHLTQQGLIITLGVSSLHEGIEQLAAAYEEATLALQQKTMVSKQQVIHYAALDQLRLQEKYGLPNIEEHVRKHCLENISLQEMAASFHMSESHFSRLFKKYTGVSFVEYITQLRIDKAKELLLRPDAKIYEVSLAIGYVDSRYFSQIFRRCTGQTPSEFRKRMGVS